MALYRNRKFVPCNPWVAKGFFDHDKNIPNLTARQNHSSPNCIVRSPLIRSGHAPLVETRKALPEISVSKFRKTRASFVPDSRTAERAAATAHVHGVRSRDRESRPDQASIGLCGLRTLCFKRSLGGKPKQLARAERLPNDRDCN